MKGASQIAPLGVRIPEELKELIQSKARENGRSMNAEIISRLEASLASGDNPRDISEIEAELEHQKKIIPILLKTIEVLKETVQAREENSFLIKQHVKAVTGYDVQEFFNKHVDYEAIKNNVNKKPT